MKNVLLMIVMLCAWTIPSSAQEVPRLSPSTDLSWKKIQTQNFIILSLSQPQGVRISEQIEQVKSWVLTHWGLEDIQFRKPCKVICVRTTDELNRLFRLPEPFGEYLNGEAVCWITCDRDLSHDVPFLLTDICLSYYEEQKGVRIGYWAKRGLSVLNGDRKEIRELASRVSSRIAANQKILFSEPLFTSKREDVLAASEESKSLYDAETAMLCLMIRREFGQRRFLILISNSTIDGLSKATGFSHYSQFDSALKRYLYYAGQDARSGRMPDSYLTIKRVGG